MTRITKSLALIGLVLLLAPSAALASTVTSARTLVISEAPEGNGYYAGTDVTVVAPFTGDLCAAGGTLTVQAPIAGDVMLAGGSISINKAVAGDVRLVGGQVDIHAPIAGDLMIAAGSVIASTSAKDTHIAAGSVHLSGGSNGPVTIYGSDVTLSGIYNGDVKVVASDRLTLGAGTQVHGTLKYNAPQQAGIPPSAKIDGGVTYIGASSYLPTTEEAKKFAIAGAGVFFVVKVIAALIAAALLAGLFPAFAERVALETLGRSPSRFILLALLGFAVVVATPVFIVFLFASFVGIGIALVLSALYVLLLLSSYLYAGVLAGSALARGLFKRQSYRVSWRMTMVGMLVLYLIGIIPIIGIIVTLLLSAVSAGAILSLSYRFAFPKAADDLEEV